MNSHASHLVGRISKVVFSAVQHNLAGVERV
jgi:hypothetical protein